MAVQNIPQTLADRVNIAAQAVRTCDAKAEQLVKDRALAYDELMQLEAQVMGKSAGWEDATLSGLVPDGENAYYTAPPPSPPLPMATPPTIGPAITPEPTLHDMEQAPQPIE